MSTKRVSRYLSLILRHEPEKAAVTPDGEGWVDLDRLVENSPEWVTTQAVIDAVAGNDKQRFSLVDGRIRANQGHSIKVDLGLQAMTPPHLLFHGTYPGAIGAIEREGLRKMNRHHVHLAEETGTATTVGRRTGTPIVFTVLAGAMHEAGYVFYRSINGVWLTDQVPPKFLRRNR